MATYKTLIDGKWVARDQPKRAVPVAPVLPKRLVQMGVSDLRIGDYLADKRTRIAVLVTGVEPALEEDKVCITTKNGVKVHHVSKSVSVLVA
jgi:hypothetical protein